ncbi:sulfite exporter TauE/SafE family protein [Colidextribacter sp. OB.20]|uniref:sulfite exporter TauE/SafE family protein n=1 Tax=Colidextribacter sp. OB.20 TaxID=2304568 RepID=UPI00136CB64D|nr:sulfite exporter TauE/SafE family protein [Colidextribacter sp. OB.20]NBI11804.1 sulfite exporter TauE/SafE family protein [Colidextribacter sp. OB.20]
MLIFFLVALGASAAGAICGIGGGVIIKPVLDLFHLETVSAISFLSGCTVLTMSCYSVGRSLLAGEKRVSLDVGTPLAVGAAAGGLLGNQMFALVRELSDTPSRVGAVQSACLAAVTVGTLLYTLNKSRIPTHQVRNKWACALIGLVLGCMSSFLGIGGGPINLVVMYFFFSMDTKTAAANSLYIIFFSQLCSLLTTLFTASVPEFHWPALVLMAAGGLGGGVLGRRLNRRMDSGAVEWLFVLLMSVIILISLFNTWRYLTC